MAETELLQLYDLSYSDLFLLASDDQDASSFSATELRRLESLRTEIMEALGPAGPGLLSVSGVPNAARLQRDLSLARGLALLDPDHRKRVLKEQNLGTDVPLKDPERRVSSFAMQLRYDPNWNTEQDQKSIEASEDDDVYKNLGRNLNELGFTMMQIGIRIARVADAAIGVGRDLELSLLGSSAAKGRLIHYHSELDRQALRNRGKTNARSGIISETRSELWQDWHYDYGLFTVLTPPLFLLQQATGDEDFVRPDGRTFLRILDPRKKSVFDVKASPESFVVQVGESAEVISGGKLRAALHSVAGPGKLENLSREMFVVFLQPAWDTVLRIGHESVAVDSEDDEIIKMVPPLSSRLKDGMTFSEFSRETTRQYYGGSGLHSKFDKTKISEKSRP